MTVSAKREASVEIKSKFDSKGVQDARRALREEQRAQARQAKQAERDAKRLRKEMLGAGRGLLGGVGEGLQLGLGFQALGGIEGAARGVFDFNEQVMRFGLAARKTPEQAAAIGEAARRIAAETGLASETVLAGARAFVDLAGAEHYSEATMRMLARTAQASGAAIGDMATVAYSLTNALKVKPEELEDVIGGLINQSKDGTIHFQNMAQEIIALGPKFARFGVLGREGASELGAFLQIAGSGFKDAAEASTGIQGLFRGLQLHEDKFRKAGIAVMAMGKDGAKHLRPLKAIVDDIAKSKLMKDPSLLLKDIGRGEGDAFLRLWIENMTKYKELLESAQAHGVVQKDLATVTESTSGRMAIAMEKVKNAIAEAFTPERIEAFTHAITGLADHLEPVTKALGLIADVIGGFEHAGESVRSFLTPDDSVIRGMTPDEIDTVANENHMSSAEAARALQASYGRSIALKRKLLALTPGDRPSPEGLKLAIATELAPTQPGLTDEQSVARSYINAAHLPADKYHALIDEVQKEQIDAQIKSGQGRSTQQYDMEGAFLNALKAGAPDIGRSVAQAIAQQPPNIKIGSEPLVKGTKNAHVLHANPGGRK